ncbi:hypothetical protein MyNCGM121_47780 [Achromobacter xylosoxidans]
MNFLFDNNLPPAWAATMSAASRRRFTSTALEKVVQLRERFPANTQDLEWLEPLGREKNWCVISCDAFRKQNGAERRAIRQFGLSVFVLQPSWASKPYWEKTAQFILWWPRIVDQANAVEASALEVPWRASGRFRQL